MENSTVTDIQIPYPEASDLHLRITVGACRLKITPGAGPDWVTGTYSDPSGAVPLRIEQEGGTARIGQNFNWAELWNVTNMPPRFDLVLSTARPYALTLEIGASEGAIDLGGLPISRLAIRHGAGKQDFDFSAPNPQPMELLSVQAGAAAVEMKNLANANFSEMTVEGGAASYIFDFGGSLVRDATAKIAAGMAAVEIYVPTGTAAKITTETVMGSADIGDGFMKKEGAFWNEAALAGKTPVLTLRSSVAMGSIKLRNR